MRFVKPRARPVVLVVDDEAMSRLLITEALSEFNFDIEEAEDGEPALQMFERLRPDIVLLDVVMPEMDGFEVCVRMRALPLGRHIPILLLTALDDVDSIRRAYEVGATDFVTKPINYLILGHRLRYMLRATRAAEELRAGEKRLSDAQRLARLGHWEWSFESKRFYLSPYICNLLKIPVKEEGYELGELFQYVHEEDHERVLNIFQQGLNSGTAFSLEHRLRGSNGLVHIVHQEAEPAEGSYWMGTLQDITERRRSEETILRLAYYDNLTHLPNQAFLVEYLKNAISTEEEKTQRFFLFSLDLDNFKRINNTWGLHTGNKLLKSVARRLGNSLHISRENGNVRLKLQNFTLREQMLLIHPGGDKFIVLANTDTTDAAGGIAGSILKNFSEPFAVDDNQIFLTASLGIVNYPDSAVGIEELLTHAELATHYAKEKGGNNFQFYDQSMNLHMRSRVLLEYELRRALENNEFEIFYQPKIAVADRQVTGVESLIRWHHPERGLVGPDHFIGFMEESNMIEELGEWVLRTSCRQAKQWHEQGHRLNVAVNVSARQFKPNKLSAVINEALLDSGLDPACLELEITERILMEDSGAGRVILDELKAIGLQIALDDFGTGYSSLSYLKHFRPDTLKIDRSFIRDVSTQQDSASITEAVVALSKILNLKVVAEGVEDETQFTFLRKCGCTEAQGYLFSRPLPVRELEEWLDVYQADTVSAKLLV